jgi:colanic acid biosynthesis glycosyl transferase WcaI
MKIVVVSQYYYPESVGIPVALARRLCERGHDVVVVTGYPNYPAGRIFAGYKQRIRFEERCDGVRVRRVPLLTSHTMNGFGRVANYVSFAMSSAFVGRLASDADAVYVYAPQMTAAVGPWLWRWLWRTPFVLHIQDLWPESITASSLVKSRLIERVIDVMLTRWLRRVYSASSAVIATSPSMRSMLERRGARSDTVHVVYNWATEERISSFSPDPTRAVPGVTRITFAGNLGVFQDLETIIRAAALVADLTGVHIRFVGDGVAERSLRHLVDELGLRNVEFSPRRAVEDMGSVHATSDFEVVCLKDCEIFDGTIPSKFQSSLFHGVPVISTVRGDMSRVVADNNLGFVARPEDPDDLARVFRHVACLSTEKKTALARRARAYYDEHLSEDRAINHIESILAHASGISRKVAAS